MILSQNIPEKKYLFSLVKNIIEAGCTFFVLYGDAADSLHKKIDEIIEEGTEEWLNVSTTSHKGEKLEDVAWFFMNATYLESHKFRCLAVIDEKDHQGKRLVNELMKLQRKLPAYGT
jgi:hypothetical protein